MKFAKILGAAAIVIGAATSAHAVSLVTNGSFELGTDPGGGFLPVHSVDSTTITGWTVSAGNVDYIGGYWQAADGSRSLDMNGDGGPGTIQQTINGLISGHLYQVSFDLAGNTDGGPTIKTLNAQTDVGHLFQFDITGHSRPGNMGWTPESFFFLATGSSVILQFNSTVTEPCCYGPALDNIAMVDTGEIVQATPLPAALPLFAGGLGVIGLIARRRKKAEARAA